jgi:hypothetical protein
MPMILVGLQEIKTTGTASFKVLASPLLPGSTSRVVGRSSRLSKTPSGTGAQVEAQTKIIILAHHIRDKLPKILFSNLVTPD